MAWELDNPTDWGQNGPGGGTPPDMGGGGVDWGKLGSSMAMSMAPGLASTGFGALMNQIMPGRSMGGRLIDTRTPQQQGVSQMGFDRLSALQNNPSSFGLPGDPNDVNTPAGRKRWDIVNQSRSADAARGMSTTGGSAQRETDALNRAQGADYNQAWQTSANAGAGWGGMSYQPRPAQTNPWSSLITGVAKPGIESGVTQLLKAWGLG